MNSFRDLLSALSAAALGLIWPALFFAGLALLVRRAAALRAARNAAHEVGTNLALFAVDVLFVAPALSFALAAFASWLQHLGFAAVAQAAWAKSPPWIAAATAIVAGDFIGYWRHRFEHLAWIWPAHAIHHSDRAMTWTTSLRFHPINRLTTSLIDTGLLALFGLPAWALALNNLVRHYYGLFVHTDLPWTYGPLGRLLVSPAMHRWHHARDKAGYNFATIFSVFDQAFGTYYAPGPCTAALGVSEETGRGALGLLAYPFFAVWRALRRPNAASL